VIARNSQHRRLDLIQPKPRSSKLMRLGTQC